MADYLTAYKITLGLEGGYSDNPDDFGKRTICGISEKYNPDWNGWILFDALVKQGQLPADIVKGSTMQDLVQKYYKEHYWNPILGDSISDQDIANDLFDVGVNLGIGDAVKFLQRGLNILNKNASLWPDITVDGGIGPKTLGVLDFCLKKGEKAHLIKVMVTLRGYHYIDFTERYPQEEEFIDGWLNRDV